MRKRLFYDDNLWKCISICFLISAMSFGYYILLNDGIFILRDDFNTQQIPFATALNGALKQWSGEWCWNIDLGTQLIGGYSFYNLGSPFFWISLLVHKNLFPYIVGILYIFKYVFTGCTAYLYIKLFLNNSKYAIIGALLYTFSGFQCENLLFYHFHDVVAFFPLLLLGIEIALEKRQYFLFIIAVFLNCLVNYFFFVGEVLFLMLYFIFRFWDKPQKMLKNIIVCVICGMLGVGMASILFIPSILFILGNSRSHTQIYLESVIPFPTQLFYYLKGFLLPGEAMHNQSCIFNQEWNSASAYLPLIGISLPLAYILKKRDWLSKLLILLVVIAFSPLLSSSFYLFTVNYQRWWYMLILVMSVISAIVLEKKNEFPVKKAVIINIIATSLLFFLLTKLKWSSNTESIIFRNLVFKILVGISIIGLLWVFVSIKNNKGYYVKILSGLSLVCVVTTFLAIYLYRQNAVSREEYLNNYILGAKLRNLDDQYRYNILDNVLALSGEAIGVYSFNSTVSPSIAEFDRTFGYERYNFSLNPNSVPGLSQLLAAKYRIVDNVGEMDKIEDVINIGSKKYYVIADKVCPIGFGYDSYVLQEDLMQIDVNDRGIFALDNLVIASKDENKISPIMIKRNVFNEHLDFSNISTIVDNKLENSVKNFCRSNSGFECETDYDKIKTVYFSVPYDRGWKAIVDDKQIDIIKANGMMAIIVPEGKHHVVFHYKTPGLREGIWVSIISFAIFLAYVVYMVKLKIGSKKLK